MSCSRAGPDGAQPNVDIFSAADTESIYEVGTCGEPAGAASAGAGGTMYSSHVPNSCIPHDDSIYTNDSVFFAKCKGNTPLVVRTMNSCETSGSEYDYPYSDYGDYVPPSNFVPSTNTEPRRLPKKRRFGSRDRRLRKGSSDGQMYSVLIRPDIEAVSFKQSYSEGFDPPGYASRIEHFDSAYECPPGYARRIDSNTDLYSAQPDQVDAIYSRPRGSRVDGALARPAPDQGEVVYSRYSDDSCNESGANTPFTSGYLTSVRKNFSVSATSSNSSTNSHVDFQPPVPDHYQASSILKRNLFRHQFQTVHEKTACISIQREEIKFETPASRFPMTANYHEYVNGKVISKPPLPRRQVPALQTSRPQEHAPGPILRSLPLNAKCADVMNSDMCISLPVPMPRTNFPSPDDMDSDNYLSLRFSERTRPRPIKRDGNI